ncbi:MAG: GDP-mannose 4,6-dehydratase [Pseudomonadota bacterium]
MKIAVTGGAGFIGNHVLREALARGHEVVCIDSLSYAASLSSIWALEETPSYSLKPVDIRDHAALTRCFEVENPDAVIHLAAESDTARGREDARAHVGANLEGTQTLLAVATDHWRASGAAPEFRFLHVSTGAVFGSLGETGRFGDDAPHRPSHPNAATKAGADHLVRAWGQTHGLPVLTTHGCNTYGPWQHPEKLIPATLVRAVTGQAIDVHGDGRQAREWLHVSDHARALVTVLERGGPGESYNVSSGAEMQVIDIVRALCRLLQVHRPAPEPYGRLIAHVEAPGGSDFRSALDAAKLRERLGWSPQVTLDAGLGQTIDWYLNHHGWWLPLLEQAAQAAPRRPAFKTQSERSVA